ncbi:MAG: cytochrome c [Woeseiaceae bacterium]
MKIKLFFLCSVFIYTTGVNAASRGEKLYMQNCMVCHADDGTGAMPGVLDLEENRAWSTMNKIKLLTRLKQGIQKSDGSMGMPAKGGNSNLTDKELNEIINYMHQSFLK